MAFEADILIAQSVYDAEPGVSALAMAWQIRPPDPVPWAVYICLKASRDLIGSEHKLTVRLEKEDGSEVDPELQSEVEFDHDFEVRGVEGLSSPINLSYGFNLVPVPLPADEEFRLRLLVDGESHDHWIAHFRTAPETEPESE